MTDREQQRMQRLYNALRWLTKGASVALHIGVDGWIHGEERMAEARAAIREAEEAGMEDVTDRNRVRRQPRLFWVKRWRKRRKISEDEQGPFTLMEALGSAAMNPNLYKVITILKEDTGEYCSENAGKHLLHQIIK